MTSVLRTSVLLSFSILFATGCSSNNGMSPVGGNSTFNCLVDGTDWSATVSASGQQAISTSYSYGNLQIVASHRPSVTDQSTIEIDLSGITSPGQFDLGTSQSRAYFVNELLNPIDQLYSTNSSYTGVVDVTSFDTFQRVASGTFSFEASNEVGSFVSIRSGNFNLVF
jgi:Family of unknown function (DUF6252)